MRTHTTSKQSTALIIIDPQNDFMDQEGASLPVSGAVADMKRLARFVDEQGSKIDQIIVTLDTHVPDHIAHPMRWLDADGKNPAPFTTITATDVEEGRFRAAISTDASWQRAYVRKLKDVGGKDLMIWPPHCIVNTHGWRIESGILRALKGWAKSTGRSVTFVEKGRNRDTEQYGAFAADVVIPKCRSTYYNADLVGAIRRHARQLWAGEALSHCLMASFDQAYGKANGISEERAILADATSPVTDFGEIAKDWLDAKRTEGVRLTTTAELTL